MITRKTQRFDAISSQGSKWEKIGQSQLRCDIDEEGAKMIDIKHRWTLLTQKLAPLTASPIIKKISFANANPITRIFL